MYIQPNAQIANMAEKFITAAPDAAAKFFEALSTHEALQFLSGLKAEYITACLSRMAPARSAAILRRMPPKQAAHIINNFNITLAAQTLDAMPPHHRTKIERDLPARFKSELKNALSYPKGSAGALARSDFFTFKTDAALEEIINKLKNLPRKKVPHQLYILDKQGRLAGIIRGLDLAFYNKDAAAGSVMQAQFTKITPQTTAHEAVKVLHKNALQEVSVVNKENILVGVFDLHEVPKQKKPKSIFNLFKKRPYKEL